MQQTRFESQAMLALPQLGRSSGAIKKQERCMGTVQATKRKCEEEEHPERPIEAFEARAG